MQCRQTGSTTSELGKSIPKAGRDSSTVTVPSPLDFVFEMVVNDDRQVGGVGLVDETIFPESSDQRVRTLQRTDRISPT